MSSGQSPQRKRRSIGKSGAAFRCGYELFMANLIWFERIVGRNCRGSVGPADLRALLPWKRKFDAAGNVLRPSLSADKVLGSVLVNAACRGRRGSCLNRNVQSASTTAFIFCPWE